MRKRFTLFTPIRQSKFLERLADGWSVTDAARAAGIVPRTAYNYRTAGMPEYDPVFAAAWDDALESGADRLEDEATRRAVEGVLKPVFNRGVEVGLVREYSDALLQFLLKGRRPEKYADQMRLQVTIRETAERLAAEHGLDASRLIARAEAIANGRA